MCVDCHEFMKGASAMLERVVTVRELRVLHTFEAGACSCGDEWRWEERLRRRTTPAAVDAFHENSGVGATTIVGGCPVKRESGGRSPAPALLVVHFTKPNPWHVHDPNCLCPVFALIKYKLHA